MNAQPGTLGTHLVPLERRSGQSTLSKRREGETRVVRLRPVDTIRVAVRKPFNFRLTLWKPSHFRTGLETHTSKVTRRTFRLGDVFTAAQMHMDGSTFVAEVFASAEWTEDLRNRLAHRLDISYGLSEDISDFLRRAKATPTIAVAAKRLDGMKISCPESVFEISILSLLLQNTTIQRSTQMMEALLRRYGAIVHVNDWSLRAYFSPAEMLEVKESELRSDCRLGYRAKYLPRFAEFFAANDNESLMAMSPEDLRNRIQTIKGVGPYTANIVASHVLRDPNALPLDVWNRRLLARALFNTDDASPDRIQRHCRRLFPGSAGLAALYLIEHQYLDNPLDPLLKD